MKKLLLTFFILLFNFVLASNGEANNICLQNIDMKNLRTSIGQYSGNYGDLPNRINCELPIKNQKLICQDNTLIFMEKLDHMAYVYAYENATKRELDHRKSYGINDLNQMLNSCSSIECVCENFKKSAEEYLGGNSPYQNSPSLTSKSNDGNAKHTLFMAIFDDNLQPTNIYESKEECEINGKKAVLHFKEKLQKAGAAESAKKVKYKCESL